jgi:hypothetical protein
MTDSNRAAYDAGWQAWLDGVSLYGNPHEQGTSEAEWWEEGWGDSADYARTCESRELYGDTEW